MALSIEKQLGKLIDELETRRRHRMLCEKTVESCKKLEDEQKQLVLQALVTAGLEGARGSTAQVTRVVSPIPTVVDWDKFYGYIKKNNAFDLLHRRVTTTAVIERWEAGKTIPGVDRENRLTLHVSTLRKEA